ncbi:transposase [Streptomyces nigra]|uniref:transposase n=1 Tax=Streptomyces nigra TaxID=1827580 RepID=UPI0036C1FFD2
MTVRTEHVDGVIGVDTHRDTLAAAAASPISAVLARTDFPANARGSRRLLDFSRGGGLDPVCSSIQARAGVHPTTPAYDIQQACSTGLQGALAAANKIALGQTDWLGAADDAEPADHGLGRSRGGCITKIHLTCEQGQRPLSLLVTAGQRGDSPQFTAVLEAIRIPRLGLGRPRVRPTRVRADTAYSSRANRAYL